MKRILITSTDLMMVQFLLPHVRNLRENGYAVELACSEVGGRLAEVREALPGIPVHPVRLVRSPATVRNFLGYLDLKNLISQGKYHMIWTNEPVMGVVTRLAAWGSGVKVLYMCHGFHFYKGCGPLNWLLWYPVERVMSRLTHMLVTINREDEARAKTMHAGRIAYIHGIGVNTRRLHAPGRDFRRELGLTDNAFLVLSVGELSKHKNHQVIIRAIAALGDPHIHYAVCGKGPLLNQLTGLARKLGVAERVHFLGYRKDLADIYAAADVFAHPSRREGLGLAPLEAMHCGLPLIAADTRGIRDYGKNLIPSEDVKGFTRAIRRMKADENLRNQCGERNRQAAAPYCLETVKEEVLQLIESL